MNIRDIARLAEVTPGTVSKVLNNYPDIGEATRQHVLKIIEENHFEPRGWQKKAESSALRVGMVVESVFHPFYAELEDSLAVHLHNAGYIHLLFHDNYFSQDKQEKLSEMISFFQPEKLMALIYIGGNFAQVPQEYFSQLPCPTIFINTVLPYPAGATGYSSVEISHYETALAQMNLIISEKHRHICTVISSAIDNSVYSRRYSAYRTALADAGLPVYPFVETDYQPEKAYGAMREYIRAHPETTAVCCGTDIVAPAILRAIRDEGLRPGEDVRLLSFDGLRHMKYCIPSVSTFEQPAQDIVRYTLHLMEDLIAGRQQHQHITFRPLLKRRESF